MKEIYLDNAATTPMDPRVKRAMEPYWTKEYGNPSGLYRAGRRAKDALDKARADTAAVLNSRQEEIIFTGGGTESVNLAVFGVARAFQDKGRHIITSKIEHHAVLRSLEALEQEGFKITYLDVDEFGLIDPQKLGRTLRPDTVLVSIIYANNEIGTIEPIVEIGKVIRKFREENKNARPYFHTDACQAAGALDLDVQKLGVDFLSLNGSKIYGPKGVGCLYARRGIKIKPLIYGGGQENNLRSGTENVPGIVGFAKALKIAQAEKEKENARLTRLRDYFITEAIKRIPKIVLNGHPALRLPNNINISVLDIEGEAAILYLDAKGIFISTGSACTSVSLDPSHVILAIGHPYEYAHGSLRFTLGRKTVKKDLDYVLDVLPKVVARLREISPIKMEMKKKL